MKKMKIKRGLCILSVSYTHLAGRYGMAAAERPAAPCLATRFPYGTHLTYDALRQVEKGEAYLKQFGFYNVRLRVHGGCARIEVDEDVYKRQNRRRYNIYD